MLLSCLLFGCNSENSKVNNHVDGKGSSDNIQTFIGIIEEITDQKTALIVVEEGGILQSSNKVFVDLSVNATETFQVGDQVKVGFDGAVRESYPAQIETLSVEKVE